ncbi:RNA-dependent RNA polymerase [Erthesina fullo arlivirus 1]|uniref:RNA-dependent RNA polymerase n=1 Tax=Erthesina fullo arlivirus 1 TaxID=2945982 RepID=UPI002481B727|nr:RNA-dependent RNA polymerase [Erthesina fullo arlivirus 1]URA30374.1 RNA-dependent RNA polymerase [Erthesina fullo arlivirus 1]
MDFYYDIDDEQSSRKDPKPFLPDLHLKSALKLDNVKEIGDLIVRKRNNAIDPQLINYAEMIKNYLISKSKARGIEFTLIYGEDVIKFLPYLISSENQIFSKSLNEILRNNEKHYTHYLSVSKEYVKNVIDNLINPEDIDKLTERLLDGLPEEKISELMKSSRIALDSYKKLVKSKIKIPLTFQFDKETKIPKFTDDSNFQSLYRKMDRLIVLRNYMMRLQVKRKKVLKSFSLYQDGDTIYTDQYCCINFDTNLQILFSYDYILLCLDTVCSRFLTYLYLSLLPDNLEKLYPSTGNLISFYQWGDNVLKRFGNKGYNLIKKLEATCIGVYLKNWDKLSISHEFLNSLIDSVNEDFKEDYLNLIQLLNKMENPNQLFEIFGLYRHMGHPFVDEENGCKTMKSLTREKVKITRSKLMNCLGASKKHFILNYLKKEKCWPNINMDDTLKVVMSLPANTASPDTKDRFIHFLKQKLTNINEYEYSFHLHLWSSIVFSKTFEYNDFEDFTILLSDTAISPKRQHWGSIYNHRRVRYKMPRDWSYSRRTLINLLKLKKFSNKNIRETIMRKEVPRDWKIVCLHSKERELKIDSRLFAMMPIEPRMYFAGSELNISDTIYKYVPTQTMTDSEAELNAKLLNVTNLRGKTNKIPITFSLDIDKWNNRWRQASTEPFFKMIDDLFGTVDYYTYSHKFFEESYFCLSSFDKPPDYLINDPDLYGTEGHPHHNSSEFIMTEKRLRDQNFEKESNTTWIGQGGGCEGLRQKGWTFITTSALLATEEVTGIKSYIVGMGDNQLIVALFPKLDTTVEDEDYMKMYSTQLTESINQYKNTIEDHINGLGMKLKLEETWVSSSLMNYGKEILINGCFVSGSLKRISRAYSEVNEVYPTLSTRISSIFSSGHSTASKSYEPLISYIISSGLALYTFDQEVKGRGISNFNFKENTNIYRSSKAVSDPVLNTDKSLIFLSTNKEIGAYPIMPLLEILFRGHPDQFSTYLSTLIHSGRTLDAAKKVMIYINKNYCTFKDVPINYQKLIQDPTSLNWKNVSLDTGKISQLLDKNLRKIVVNEEIQKLLLSTNEKEGKEVIEYLSSTEPMIPRVLNEIFRHSPEGAKLQYLSTFSDMKTMKEMMTLEDSNELIQFIEKSEQTLVNHVYSMIDKISIIDVTKDKYWLDHWNNSFRLSENITNDLWEKNVEGSRIPHPAQQFILCRADTDSCWVCNMNLNIFTERIDLILNKNILPSDDKILPLGKILGTRGPFPPYTGSSTKEKRSKSLINFPKGDRALHAAQNLFRVQEWVVSRDNNLYEFITSLIKSRTEIPIDILRLASGKYYGGSVIHRFQDVVTKHSCRPNNRPNLNSHIYISSDKMGKYSGGKDNYYIHFQSVYLYAISLINLVNIWSPKNLGNYYHLHVICYGSVKPIVESPIRANKETIPKLSSLKGSVLLYSSVKEYTDRCLDIQIHGQLIRDVSIHSEMSKEFSLPAVGIIIYSYMIDQANPLLQGQSINIFKDTTHCPLTLDDLITFKLPSIFEQVGIIWFLDNLYDIMRTSIIIKMSVMDTVRCLLKNLPTQLFSFIKSLSCSTKILDEFSSYGWYPTSSNYPINSSSLDRLYISAMITGIKKYTKSGNLYRYLTPFKNITTNRLILLYFYSIIYQSELKTAYSILKYIDIIKQEFYKLRDDKRLSISNLWSCYSQMCAQDSRLRGVTSKDSPFVSSCGPEAWIRLYKSEYKDVRTSQISIKSFDSIQHHDLAFTKAAVFGIKSFHLKRDLRFDKRINISDSIPKNSSQYPCYVDIGTPSSLWKGRTTHLNRLTGLYSTAHYKYSEIFSRIKRENFQVSINLAEGAGGTCKLCSQWFNCSKIIYNSLINLEEFVSQRAIDYTPPELIDLIKRTNIKLFGVSECISSGGDLTDSNVISIFKKLIQKHVRLASIMTMDAEQSKIMDDDTIRTLIHNTLELFNLLPKDSILIIKTFYWHQVQFSNLLYYIHHNFHNLRVIKPFYSSFENTEIFLYIKKLDNQIKPLVNTELGMSIDLNHLYFKIMHPVNFSDILMANKEEKVNFHKNFNQLGFSTNFHHSLLCFTNDIIDENEFERDPIHELSTCIDLCISIIQLRMREYGKDLILQRVPQVYRLIKSKLGSESLDLGRIGETYINLYILRDLLITQKYDTTWVERKISIQLTDGDTENIYEIRTDIGSWGKKYQRHIMRIIGHLSIGPL